MNDGDRCSDLRWARVESDTHNHRLSLSDPPCGHAAVVRASSMAIRPPSLRDDEFCGVYIYLVADILICH